MLQLLPKQKEDTNKVNTLNALSLGYYTIDPDEGLKYAQQALVQATRLKWKRGIANANLNFGVNYLSKSDYQNALKYLSIGQELANETGIKIDMANAMLDIGNVYSYQGNSPKALEYYAKALKLAEECGNKQVVTLVLYAIGGEYFNQCDYPTALDYFFKCLKFAEETENKELTANLIGNIGTIYGLQNDFQKALEYSLKSLKMDEELGNRQGIAYAASNIGCIYNDGFKDYSKALEYLLKALKIDEEMGDKKGISQVIGNIGEVYRRQKNYHRAVIYFQIALQIAQEIENKENLAYYLACIGELYVAIAEDGASGSKPVAIEDDSLISKYHINIVIPEGQATLLLSAIDYLHKGLTVSKEIDALSTTQICYSNLAKAYRLSSNYKTALAYSDSFATVKDSILSNDSKVKIANLATKREQDLKEKQIAINELETEKKHDERVYFSIGLGFMALLVSGLIFNLRYVRKSRKTIQNEKEVSEGLLLNILPAEVAKELKEKGRSDAKHFEQATVLFTDFKDFTQLSEKLTAEELVAELDYCFKGFDSIIQKHGVEKIKTIGDSYMAVGGIPDPSKGSAHDVVAAALEMKDFILNRAKERQKDGKRSFEMRIGIHTGPVIAGIVGLKKFQYDIWGDTVNIASRMESSGTVGKINISQTTYELVKDKFACGYRGEIDAKGKGMLKMYFVARA